MRRVFCIVLEDNEVLEWYAPTDSWARLDAGARIRDVCLSHPLPVAALLNAAAADEAVVDALRARKSEALAQLERHTFREGRKEGHTEGRKEGRLEARRQSVLDVCEVLSVPLTEERQKQLSAMNLTEVEALLSELKRRKSWP